MEGSDFKDFKQGQKLKSIFWTEGEALEVGKNCLDIEVVMENGQMAGVPWAIVNYENPKRCIKFNLALVEGVELLI